MGDMLSSFIVLCMGIVLTVFDNAQKWTYYIDPITRFVYDVLLYG